MEAVVAASIEIVLQNLLTLSEEQISLVGNFSKDLDKLRKSFLMVRDFLHDAQTRQVSEMAVKRWLRSLEHLAFEADNVFDEISYRSLQPKKMKKNVQSFILCNSTNNPISYRLKLGRRIRDINEELKVIKQEASDFGLQAIIRDARAPGSASDASGSMETDSFSVDLNIIGREHDLSRIVELLITTTSSTEQVLSVLPIVGMGGLGKTTLAKKVFGDQQIISHFGDNRVWVYVSQNFDIRNILKNILTSLTGENNELGTNEALLKKLQKVMGDKRYLLVLDDNWSREKEMWGDFVNSLLGISSVAGNCMIVTTRSQDVASIVGTLPIHELKGLSDDDCWSIIKAKAFGAGDIPTEFEAVGRNIAERCKGLPLAAKVVGGVLCGKSKDEWLSIEKTRLSNFGDGNSINKILKLSFDNLSLPSLKKCFAYCSIFPKGYEIIEERLIWLWMAEGFLQTDKEGNSMETTGGKFLNLLLRNSLLQVARRDSTYGYVTHWSMHDLVHDLACSVSGENNSVTDEIFQSRYIGYNSNVNGSCSISKGQARYLRTLFFNGNVSDIKFKDFRSLRTLTLAGKEIKILPSSIRELIHLRYLDTAKTWIRYFPSSLGELYHLETLITSWLFPPCLPNSIKYLIQLRHLDILFFIRMPPEIGRLTSLQTLPWFRVLNEKGCGISELGNLKNLKGSLRINNLGKVHDKNEATSANMFQKSGIYELVLQWNEADREDEENDESVLQALQPHPNIKSLQIYGFSGKRLPLWISKMTVQDEGLNSLIKIELSNWRKCEELPMLGHLPHLKSLCLRNFANVRSIGSSFYNIENCSSSGIGNTIVVFPALERLEMPGMSSLIEWAGVEIIPAATEVVVFPRLEWMELRGCRQLKSAPSHFPSLKELEISDMDSGVPLENILCGSSKYSRSLTSLRMSRIKGLECLPDGVFANNHNLKSLSISECLNLRELHTLNSLEILVIEECPNLKSIAAYPPNNITDGSQIKKEGCFFSTSLSWLSIRKCQELTHLPIEMVESCAPSLETLNLSGLNSLTNIPMVIRCLHKMPRLRGLTIVEVPKFSPTEIGSLSLKRLEMGPWTTDDNNVTSFNEVVDAILQTSKSSLCYLSLRGMSHWDCLPDQIQHLISLGGFDLHGYGMEALPEWLGNLPSLQYLSITECNKLQHFPSMPHLAQLVITHCPLLLKEVRSSNEDPQIVDSEWHKISHIPTIMVDSHIIAF